MIFSVSDETKTVLIQESVVDVNWNKNARCINLVDTAYMCSCTCTCKNSYTVLFIYLGLIADVGSSVRLSLPIDKLCCGPNIHTSVHCECVCVYIFSV